MTGLKRLDLINSMHAAEKEDVLWVINVKEGLIKFAIE